MSTEPPKLSSVNLLGIWFGAAVSIAEILTGSFLAPLGLAKGIATILVGHLIGALILFLAGVIGAQKNLTSMESTRLSFGIYGSYGFSLLNIIQLLGWTAIMIASGAAVFDEAATQLFAYSNPTLWSIGIGLFICFWIAVGLKNLAKINAVVVSLLFIFCVVLGFVIFRDAAAMGPLAEGSMSFGGGVELSVAMSLSWLPLIADYTRSARRPIRGTAFGVIGYAVGSSFMFIIGLGAALYSGTSDIGQILMAAGLGIPALFVVFFSTTTTTFLDVLSAGISCTNLFPRAGEKSVALLVCIAGVALALLAPLAQFENFLYFIGSVFAPLYAVLFTDYFILRRADSLTRNLNLKNGLLWLIGFVLYRLLLPYNTPVGTTTVVIILTGIICVLFYKAEQKWLSAKTK
ncbi:putative hydroxymethylpyrimidine transporter CytX [Pontiella agarivorans]|uniref:Hydroxymethylpyrimidine transporter CytX n=1 Tax=Pontiella agarivorans TaxID=3038953 RepID=A0ABU5N0G1_9BACT|nr:putative hydroxymethylpyrimidine transporter CytX [Pontiella agarivorans]MDZ8119923.1 putative hydroxymethylpyrimidine transporter CytX [Pontiella agarivorans]